MSFKKLLYLLLILTFGCNNDEDDSCQYDTTLVTLEVTDLTETTARLNGTVSITSSNCEAPSNATQGFVYATSTQPTVSDNKVNASGTDITAVIENLELATTYYVRAFLANDIGEFYGNEVSFQITEFATNPVYLDDNGITVKARDWAQVGATGEIDGVSYTVIDRPMLDAMLANNQSIVNTCTTRITDMSELFKTYFNFNQDISSWDVSNVTSTQEMFYGYDDNDYFLFPRGEFNQDIGNWDVSHVNDMEGMFMGAAAFNRDISNMEI